MSGLDNRLKKKDLLVSEQDCMRKFYEPINNKQRILNKWLKKPKR